MIDNLERDLDQMEKKTLLMRYVEYGHGKTKKERILYLQAMEQTLTALNLDITSIVDTIIMIQDIGNRVLDKK